MKNIFKYKTLKQLSFLCIGIFALSSCKDWTEIEPITIKKSDAHIDNPALYAQYLEDLRLYKASAHNMVFGWYDNSEKNAFNQSHHIGQLPDSLDYVVLKSPDNISDKELIEINSSKEDRSFKFLYDMDIEGSILAYQQLAVAEQAEISIIDYVTNSINKVKDLASKYPYDGVVISYSGRDTVHLNAADKATEKSIQQLFNTTVQSWISANTGKEFVYKGNPQTLLDKSILSQAKYIILPTLSAISKNGLSFSLANAAVADVPQDKFVVMVNAISYKPEDIDKKVGLFSDGSAAIKNASEWVVSDHGANLKVKGLAIENLQYDYFNILKSYKYSREAINTLNPSIKN